MIGTPEEPDLKNPLLESIQSLKRWTVILYVVLGAVSITFFVLRSYDLANVEETATRNTTALCALRSDLRDRAESGRQFLEHNPGGLPGISAAQIRENIETQQRTIETLKIIDCSDVVINISRLP